VTLETAVSGLEGPVDPSAGCCFPVSQGFRSFACWAWNYPFSVGSESDVRDCGLWPGRTWEHWYHLTLVHAPCQFEVPWAFAVSWGLEMFGGSWRVAQSGDPSCASRVAQSWGLRKLSKAVAQAELRNPASCAIGVAQSVELRKQSFAISCVIRRKSCANVVAQSGEVSESDFILDGINHGLLSTVRGTLQI
jgi:hypothetical protein